MKELIDRYKVWAQAASRQYAVPRWLPGLLVLLPLAVLAFQLALTFPAFEDLKPIFWGENGPLENLQFILFLLGSAASLRMSWQTKKQGERWQVWLFYLGFSAVLFFISMEEIAWGQQFLDFNSPEFVKEFNVQNEFTLHNVEALQDRTDILNLIFGIGGLFAIWLNRHRRHAILAAPSPINTLLILVFVFSALGTLNDFVSVNTQYDYTIHKQTETTELFIAAAGLGYAWLNLRAFTYERPRWAAISAVKVKHDKLAITDTEERRLSVPLADYPWLLNATEDEHDAWELDENGKCIRWPRLDQLLCLDKLLKSSPDPVSAVAFDSTPLSHSFLWSASAAGLFTLLWLALLPGDRENALLFGWSALRLGMLGGMAVLLAGLLTAMRKSQRSPDWFLRVSRGLKSATQKLGHGWLALVLALGIGIGGIVFLVFSVIEQDPYYRGFLTRLAPWVFWLTVVAFEFTLLVLKTNLKMRSIRLAHATLVKFKNAQLRVRFSNQNRVRLPLAWYPRLQQASEAQREEIEFKENGLRIFWPALDMEICAQQLASGYPASSYYTIPKKKF